MGCGMENTFPTPEALFRQTVGRAWCVWELSEIAFQAALPRKKHHSPTTPHLREVEQSNLRTVCLAEKDRQKMGPTWLSRNE